MSDRVERGLALTLALVLVAVDVAAAPPSKPAGEGGAAAGSSSPPSRADCLSAHHSAQELRQKDMFIEAQQKLAICSSASCPGAVISDCGNWITDLEQRTPSMVIEVKVDGRPADNVRLFLDHEPLGDWTHAIKVNPGRHVIRAEAPRFEPYEEAIVFPEGQRMRLVPIEFKSPVAPTPALSPALSAEPAARDVGTVSRPVPSAVYPLLGVGAAGLVGFGIFAVIGRSKQTNLENTCQHRCTDSDISSMKTAYLVGDISGTVGVASLVGAAVVFLSRPARSSTAWSVDIGPVGAVPRSWGGSVAATW
jgi:hypothetical protein